MELGQSNSFCFLHFCEGMEYCISYCFSFLHASVTAHLLYELVGMYIGYLEEGPATMHRSSRLPCILYFTYMEAFSGMCFYLVFSSLFFFPQRGFGEVFFPWTCWPHVLNKSVLWWPIPVIRNVCFCVIWTSCFILLCYVTPFLHFTLPNPFY